MKDCWKNLLKIKSIITILLTLVFCILTVGCLFKQIVIPQEFILIYTTVVSFYFGTQHTKKAKKDDDDESIQTTDN